MSWSLSVTPELSEQQFAMWSKLLEDRIGVRLGEHQRQFLQTQVGLRMREIGQEDVAQYFHHLTQGVNGRLEWTILVDRLVVKETSFFRHLPSLNFVSRHLQELINRQFTDSYDIWSLGCSTGEEPYSLAMLVNESYELAKRDPYFGITATDISRVAISIAKAATYTARKLEFVAKPFQHKYFRAAGPDKFRFEHEVAEKICFNCANVMQVQEMPHMKFDVIYCQNMLVYFSRELRHFLLDELATRLKPGGILVVGLGEVVNWNNSALVRVADSQVQAYQRGMSG